MGVSLETSPDDIQFIDGIVHGLVLGERFSASRQLSLASIVMRNDPFLSNSGAFQVLLSDVILHNSRPFGSASSYARFWQPPKLFALE